MKEKEIEDYIERNPDSLASYWEGALLLGRQVRLDHGVVDLVLLDGNNILVVELKAGPPKPQDVCQVLRYTHDIKKYVHNICTNLLVTTDIDLSLIKYYLDEDKAVIPILVGAAHNEKIAAAMEAAGGSYITWQKRGNDFCFLQYGVKDNPRPNFRIVTTMEYVLLGKIRSEQ